MNAAIHSDLMNGVIAIYDAIKEIKDLEAQVAEDAGAIDVLTKKLAAERAANEDHKLENIKLKNALLAAERRYTPAPRPQPCVPPVDFPSMPPPVWAGPDAD